MFTICHMEHSYNVPEMSTFNINSGFVVIKNNTNI